MTSLTIKTSEVYKKEEMRKEQNFWETNKCKLLKFNNSQTISIIEFKLKPYFASLTLIENCSTNKKTLLPY